MARTVIFRREDTFYPIYLPDGYDSDEQLMDHIKLNPGTLAVEDLNGTILWKEAKQ